MRHGATKWNEINKLQGQTDIPLDENGVKMAQKAAGECSEVHFDICFCSPLERAKQTADIVLRSRNVPIVYDDRLKEMSFGEYEGTKDYWNIPDSPIGVLFSRPEEYIRPVPGGESFDELFTRTGQFMEQVIEPLMKEGKDVLIVGHGVMNTCIICRLKNIPLRDFWSVGIKQCKLTRLI